VTRSGAPQGGAFAAAAQSNRGDNTPTGQEPRESAKRFLFRWRNELRRAEDISPQVNDVLLALSMFADNDTGVCWPGRQQLACTLKRRKSYVSKYLAEAVRLGWAVVDQRGSGGRGGGPGKAAHYRLTIPVDNHGNRATPVDTFLETGPRIDGNRAVPVEPNSQELPRTPNGNSYPQDALRVFAERGIAVEATPALVAAIKGRMEAKGYSPRHIAGELLSIPWPADVSSPEGLVLKRLDCLNNGRELRR
jgi:hypothetical protein